MCTLLFRWRLDDPYPLAALANRDEALNRPSSGWRWQERSRRMFAPLDERAGGTWIGLNEAGLLAGLTNIHGLPFPMPTRSRGLLVRDVLESGSAREAAKRIQDATKTDTYAPFNLLVASSTAAMVFTWDGNNLREAQLEPGSYQLDNSAFNGNLLPAPDDNMDWMKSRTPTLAEHPEVCKHGEKYGTVSSSRLLVSGDDPTQSLIWHLEGRPCEQGYTKVWPEEQS